MPGTCPRCGLWFTKCQCQKPTEIDYTTLSDKFLGYLERAHRDTRATAELLRRRTLESDKIPADVWEEARKAVRAIADEKPIGQRRGIIIARAIMAERERCAKAVEEMPVPVQQSNSWQLGFMRARMFAAGFIRSGKGGA